MASDYNSYDGVAHLQKEVLGIGVHEADGRYGPSTDALYQRWLAGQFAAGLTEQQALSAAGMSRNSVSEIYQGITEFRALLATNPLVAAEATTASDALGVTPGAIGGGVGGPAPTGGNGGNGNGGPGPKAEPGGIPTWGWFLIGLGVLTVGYFGYQYLTKSKALGAADDTGDFGCGCGE